MTATPEPSTSPPGAQAADGQRRSVRDRLFDQRVVFLWGHLDDALGTQLAAELMTLDATGDEPVQLHIDSPGSTLEAALCLVDVIDLLGVELIATCVGKAAGPALGPLAVAHRRRATPHARFRLCEPVAELSGPARELAAQAANHQAQMEQFCARLAKAIGIRPDTVHRDLATGRFLDADEALEYGLIDEICGPGARVYPTPGTALGFRPRS